VADLEAIPDDGNRYEILHGELLVTPLPLVVSDACCSGRATDGRFVDFRPPHTTYTSSTRTSYALINGSRVARWSP
jgi:hypothetical protein